MYQKPSISRFGTFRDLTLAGCTGSSDGFTAIGSVSVGSTPQVDGGTTDICLRSGSR
jgi:hypothetical protein